jgi:hypothetical protein
VGDTNTQRSRLAAEITRVSDLLAAASIVGQHSATTAALRRARSALVTADLCCSDWTAVEGVERNSLLDRLEWEVESNDCVVLPMVEWCAARLWRSDVSSAVLRLVVGWHEWIVRVTTEDGWGDDGTGTRECVEILARGEVQRS